jgi:hypothetical protein
MKEITLKPLGPLGFTGNTPVIVTLKNDCYRSGGLEKRKTKSMKGGDSMENGLDPYDMQKKRELHPKADEKNFIVKRGGKFILCCGSRKKRDKGYCQTYAGQGTDHPGYGRCKLHGGSNTGPKTAEGKEIVGKNNARKHGLYAKHLSEEEQSIYEKIRGQKELTLYEELSLLKTKLVSYYNHVWLQERARGRKGLIRYQTKKGVRTQYEMGSIEDPNVHKTLEQIRRLVATASGIDGANEQDLVTQVNAELREASRGKVMFSWNTGVQHREEIKE